MLKRRRLLAGYGLVLAAAILVGAAAALTKLGIPVALASGTAAVATAIAGAVTVRGTSALGDMKQDRRSIAELVRLARRGRLPLVRDLNDPVMLGVHPAALADWHGSMTRSPVFVSRDVMPQLRGALQGSRFVLLVGESTAGKSRAAYEAIRECLPGYRLVEPVGRHAARAAADIAAATPRCVLWLDDLERFLGTGGLTGQAASRVLDTKGCVIVATMRSEEYARFSGRTSADPQSLSREAVRDGWDVLRLATRIDLPRRWSPGELCRAGGCLGDRRIGDALRHADQFGLAEYLAAGPQILTDWHDSWAPGTHPRGAALVCAAVDARRAGIHRPLPLTILAALHEPYLQARGGLLLRPEPLEDAIAWATTPLHATSSLLLPDADSGFIAFDYLIDAAEKSPVPGAALDSLIAFATGDEAMDIGYAAWFSYQFGQAESAFRAASNRGQWRGSVAMCDFLYDTDGADRALGFARDTLAECERAHGPEGEQTLWARYGVAFEVGRAGQPETALQLSKAVLADIVRLLGDEHDLARQVRSRIPQWIADAGTAARMCTGLAARYGPVMGAGDPFVLGLRHQAANFTGEAGDAIQAARLAGQLAEDIARLDGEASELRNARYLAAHWTAKAGRYAEAVQLWEQCVTELLGTAGRFTIQSLEMRHDLAECAGAAEDAPRAVEILEGVMADAARFGTVGHLSLLRCARSLAHWTGKAGDPDGAARQLRQLIGTTTAWRGDHDPYTLGLRWRLADWIGETGDSPEALRELEATLADATLALGAEHQVTKTSQERLRHWQDHSRSGPADHLLLRAAGETRRADHFNRETPW